MVDRHVRRAVEALGAGAAVALVVTSVAFGATPTTGVIAASDHSCALTSAGGVECWGDNSAGGLGDGTTTSSRAPVSVTTLTGAVEAIAAGDRFSCALLSGGGVKCWGNNEFGQLGNGTTTNSPTPVEVAGLPSGVTSIGARGDHACALLAAGGMKCWGANANGQLGDGTTSGRSVPADVTGEARSIAAIAVGGEHTCALTTTGGVKCWGWNATGQLGIGMTTDSSVPVDVVGLASGVDAIATGGRHTCALLTQGGVRCWGYDEFGQLGDGEVTDRPVPVDAGVLKSDATSITAGGNFTCALTTDGTVTCWGVDLTGQLPFGATYASAAPVDVVGFGRPVTAVAAGFYHACAITMERAVACWGGNDTGQLGNGTTNDSGVPVKVVHADGTPLAVAGATETPESSASLPVEAIPVLGVVPPVLGVILGIVLILAAGSYAAVRQRRR